MTRQYIIAEKASGLPRETNEEIITALRDLALEDKITIGECELLRQVANMIAQSSSAEAATMTERL